VDGCFGTTLVEGPADYEVAREQVAELVRAVIGFPAVVVVDAPLLLRALEVYELDRIDFAEAYLVARRSERSHKTIASFDRSFDKIATVQRIEPA
jgi:predicted nucleic-acid-binding protein